MTQEMIAQLLGVRREGITEAAGKLQHDGAIRYHRGHIMVFDRPALEQRVCECYTAPDIRPSAPPPDRRSPERGSIWYARTADEATVGAECGLGMGTSGHVL
jgi:hypothetical protein